MKKRSVILIFLLILMLVLSLFAACDKTPEESSSVNSTETTETAVTTDPVQTTSETETKPETETSNTQTTQPQETDPETEEVLTYPFDPDEETEGNTESETAGSSSTNCHPRYAVDDGYHWSPECDVCGKLAGQKIAHTVYGTIESEGDVLLYSYFCKRCEHTIARVEVPYDANLYLDPMTLLEAQHNFGTVPDNFVTVTSDDGVVATKFISENGSGDYVLAFSDNSNSTPTGRYAVIKVKLGSGRSSFKLEVASIQSYRLRPTSATEGRESVTISGLPAGWSTVIVDLGAISTEETGYLPSDDGEYYLCSLKITMTGASQVRADDFFKIAYVGFCDTIDEAREISQNEKVRYIYNDPKTSGVPDEIDGTPCEHVYVQVDEDHHASDFCDICLDEGGTVLHSYSFTSEKDLATGLTKYSLGCICGLKSVEKSYPSSVNCYTEPTTISMASWHGYTTKTPYAEEDTLYQRLFVGGNDAGHGATIPFTNAPAHFGYVDVNGGSGKYAVFKIRTHEVGTLSLKLASITAAEKEKLSAKELETRIPDGYPNCRGWGYNDQWVTVVVDLQKICANGKTAYVANSADAVAVFAGVQVQLVAGFEEGYIDVAYFTICDDWDEVSQVVDVDTVLYTAWAANASMVNAKPDGTLNCDEHRGVLTISNDGTKYLYTCIACDASLCERNIPTGINYYSAPGQYYNEWGCDTANNGGASQVGTMIAEDGKIYSRITLCAGAQFVFTNGSATYQRGYKVANDIYGGSGKYIVMKFRTHGVVETRLEINSNNPTTNEAWNYDNSGHYISRSPGSIKADVWQVYVIDIEAMASTFYAANDPNMTKAVFGFYFQGHDTSGSTYMDVEYFAVCDNWSEIDGIVEEDTVLLTAWRGASAAVTVNAKDGSDDVECTEHTAKLELQNNTYKYNCISCGKLLATLNAPASDKVNYFSAPGQYYNIWNTGAGVNLGSSSTVTGDVMTEDGVVFSRINLWQGGSLEFTNGTAAVVRGLDNLHDTINGGSGKYAVIKIRTGESVSRIGFGGWDGKKLLPNYSGSTQVNTDVLLMTGNATELYSHKWNVYVIDLEAMASEYYTANDSKLTNVTFGIQGETGSSIGSDEYVDVAYFAIVNDWSSVANVVGNEQVILTSWINNSGDQRLNSDGTEIAE